MRDVSPGAVTPVGRVIHLSLVAQFTARQHTASARQCGTGECGTGECGTGEFTTESRTHYGHSLALCRIAAYTLKHHSYDNGVSL